MNKILKLRLYHLLALLIIFLVFGYLLGTNTIKASLSNYQPIISIDSKNPPPGQNLDMGLFYKVLDEINHDYYDKSKIDAKQILYGAITGAIGTLKDPYTSFFPPVQNTAFKTQMSGQFSGIGAELGTNNGKIIVVSPLDGSPAQKDGIKPGDQILKVDGVDTTGWQLSSAVDKIRGPKGTSVDLTILHVKEKASVDIKITRDDIHIKSVTGWVKTVSCNGNDCQEKTDCSSCASVAYIRLSQFGDPTNNEWVAEVNALLPQIQKQKNFKGIILDVRNNPGGYLQDAVFIASEFLDSGAVVKQEDGQGNISELDVNRKGLLTNYPLVVLINGGSASASEIVSGALRDHSRAKLVGEKSFGKGTIQQAVDLDGGASVHVTIAKWLTPSGTWVHGKGLAPDIKVVYDAKKSSNPSKFDNQLQGAVSALVQ